MTKRAPKQFSADLIFIDRATLASQCSMGLTSFETYLQPNPLLKQIQHRPFIAESDSTGNLILYPADKAKEVCLQIMESWPH